MTDIRPDICVIGAGAGGLSVAAGAARLGAPVVLIEKGEMGGECLNTGCVPSKALIASAAVAQAMREAARFGVRPVEPRVEWTEVRKRVKRTIAAIAPIDSQARYEAMGVRVIRARARFANPHTVEAGGVAIRARRFVIATGSSPAIPRIPGLESVRALTNETVFDLDVLPHRLIVIGGGPVGVELAQAFRRLGSEAVILEAGTCLSREDPELARVALDRLRREGVVIREGAQILRAEPHAGGARVVLAGHAVEETIDGTHVLVAAGRRANVADLGLDAAGVRYDATGVRVRASLRTSNRRIYAVGDAVAGGSTHAASHHAALVLRQILFRAPAALETGDTPRAIYADPEIAWVGLSEDEARARHRHIRILRASFAENDRARAEEAGEGHLKAVLARDGRVLGCGIVGRNAAELLAPWSLAVARKLRAQDLAAVVAPYPTLSEISRRAAIEVYNDKARSPLLRAVLQFLRRFG